MASKRSEASVKTSAKAESHKVQVLARIEPESVDKTGKDVAAEAKDDAEAKGEDTKEEQKQEEQSPAEIKPPEKEPEGQPEEEDEEI